MELGALRLLNLAYEYGEIRQYTTEKDTLHSVYLTDRLFLSIYIYIYFTYHVDGSPGSDLLCDIARVRSRPFVELEINSSLVIFLGSEVQ